MAFTNVPFARPPLCTLSRFELRPYMVSDPAKPPDPAMPPSEGRQSSPRADLAAHWSAAQTRRADRTAGSGPVIAVAGNVRAGTPSHAKKATTENAARIVGNA